jgi:hypothetical protein
MINCSPPLNLPIVHNSLDHQAKTRSKGSLKFFCRYASDEFWQPYKHLDYLTDILEKVSRKEIRRLILNMPPQHGKSYTTSELFPVWYLGNHPNDRIILTSYGADLASGFSENARNLFRTQGLNIWDLELSESSQAKDSWKIANQRGYMISAGVGGPITGKPANLIIIDDPHKNRKEAESETIRQDVINWYKTVIRTRLSQDGCIILIQTRWHTEDLSGWLIKTEGEKWTVINLPARARENDPLGRLPGTPLCPELHNAEDLQDIEHTLGPYDYSALYDGDPLSEKGGLFKREYFRYFEIKDDLFILHKPNGDVVIPVRSCTCFQTYDPTGSSKTSADFGVIGTWYLTPSADLLLVDVLSMQKTVPEQVDDVTMMYHRFRPVAIGVEKDGIGLATLQYLQLAGLPIYDVNADADKYSRAVPIAMRYKAGMVFHLTGSTYLETLESEFLKFPKGKNDDHVDMAAYAARLMVPVKSQQTAQMVYEEDYSISPV